MTNIEKEEQDILAEREKLKKAEEAEKKQLELEEEEKTAAVGRNEKQLRTRVKVETRLEEYRQKKETQLFSSHYHLSRAGIDYYEKNNIQPPSEEVLMRMSQRLNRQQKEREDAVSKNLAHSNQEMGGENANEDNPIVALEPEENLAQASMNRSKAHDISEHPEATGTLQ